MSNQVNSLKKGLTVKDLVTTGIFSAIFFVFTLVGGLPFAPNPVLTFYMPMGAALLCGPIYLLMVAKVQKRWSVTILGIIMGIIWFATGMHWAFSLGYIGMGIIADLVAGIGHYRNKAINLLSYLQTYMGHKDWEATAYYIHLLPEKLVKSAGIDWEAMNRLIPRVELWEK